jgi:hypothetical protein
MSIGERSGGGALRSAVFERGAPVSDGQAERWIRPLALLAGLCAVGLAVSHWSLRSTVGTLGAEVRVSAVPTGELSVSRVDPFLVGRDLHPGGRKAAEGTVSVTNITAAGRTVRVRALPSATDLDGLLEVSVTAGGERLYHGTLGGLRHWTRASAALASGKSVKLEVRTPLLATARQGYAGRIEDVQLELRSQAPR